MFEAADYEDSGDAPSRTVEPTTSPNSLDSSPSPEPSEVPTTSSEPTEEPTTSNEPSEEPTTSSEPTEDPGGGSTGSVDDGTWTVGEDIEPGTYSTTVPDDSIGCYRERLSGFSGELDDIIEPGVQTTVTIESSDEAFTSQDCGTWELQD